MCAQNICFFKHPILWFKWQYHVIKWHRSSKPKDFDSSFTPTNQTGEFK